MNLKQKLAGICRRFGVQDLYAFGSRAREVSAMVDKRSVPFSTPGSDLDIGVLPVNLTVWEPERKVDLAVELEDLFQAGRVDLVFLPDADAFLALDIIRGELLFSSDPDRQARYELFVLRRAGDLMPFKKDRVKMILEQGGR